MEMISLSQAQLTSPVMNAYRHVVDGMDGRDRKSGMDDALSSLAPIDRFYVSERAAALARPTLIAHRTEAQIANRMGDYFDQFFARDPVVRALENATEGGTTVVLRIAPEDIEQPEYRKDFFERSAIIERISFVERLKDKWFILNVARRAPSPRFTEEEIQSLATFSRLLFPLAAQKNASEQLNYRKGHLTVQQLEERFAHEFPALSPRERQVCARTVVGMTSEATALDLGVGIGSVQTYRKRAFHRLEICSAFQLAHLILH
ncbi:helix-turn-helix domain-containing protein [Sphingopyxis flava]|uniref:Regulatory protein, luxR family n=1 Tax=Sphingopyxis flava TaxID=1507287 RepID=A0A1T5DX32_9SPHN|nr:helix-turn-helix transcriptional regulator [Sphingopyxis flava]SKB76207.1 regulatory protein, luxR family [Sphingopyxis flava]